MKTVVLIEDGRIQLVLTPETKHEKGALKLLEDRSLRVRILAGEYYACAGGWTRESHNFGSSTESRSLIVMVDDAKIDEA
jgi:hypothetical protein